MPQREAFDLVALDQPEDRLVRCADGCPEFTGGEGVRL